MAPRRDWPYGALDPLFAGDALAWDQFVQWSAPILHGAARRALRGLGRADVEDAVQDVFVRLCRDDFRLLRTYDPARGSLGTWLGVVAASTAIDLRRKRRATQPLDEAPEAVLAVDPPQHERLRVPPDLLTERQTLVLQLTVDKDMDVAEVAALLGVAAQTVRSTRHKAIERLRAYFRDAGVT